MTNETRWVSPSHVPGLDELADVPERLWVRGTVPEGTLVGIVGTRRADRAALEFTRALAARLCEAGAGVVSGGAEGVDASAHLGALDAGGPTWVVQAAALDDPYPRKHREMFDRVLEEGGGWLSETPPGEPAYASRFLSRNRIVAAVSRVVVVVQAPARSGALSTAKHALDLGRPLFVVPHAPWDPRGDGCLRLLRGGARPCTRPEDVAEALGLDARATEKKRARPKRPDLPPELAAVWDALSATGRHADDVAREVGMSAARTQVALIQLMARGFAQQGGDGWRVR